ncbi:enoyl-CoA hydratase/isomerase family protein [Falsiroseomonas sp.]|uniref:enoyl-CoA hydratase/isomerase family protein n=1 Tax=Falsiroseomonas sp. TaxID=2870721 RepID=UPI00273727E4|nr:enoyl-CoA hydratase-related protein [Falsiroseomonas sp.]MDP3416259.1 enoyl-CoA hydratase-related protein [Falsiroseomonas sp.]
MSEAPTMRVAQERAGGVLTLTLDYPARRNALSVPLREQLFEALEAAQGDTAVRAVVITGAGGTFCSGGDISGMDVRDAEQGRERMRRTHRIIRLMVGGRLPIVAAVEGWCVGAGLSVACASDTIVASAEARFMAGFNKVGLMADLGLPFTLPARIGVARARQVLFYAEPIGAEAAERIGLVDRLVPKGTALAAAQLVAQGLAAQAALPIALTKRMLAEGLDAALERERDWQTMCFLSADHAEGREAFMAKREPVFGGG